MALEIVFFPLRAQISIMENIPKEVKYDYPVYDSLHNAVPVEFEGKDSYRHLIGQTLMFCGNNSGNKYVANSHKSFVIGDYYKLEDVLPDDSGRGLYGRFVLRNLKTNQTFNDESEIYYRDNNFRWVVLGHYEKLKSLYVGKELVYTDTYHSNSLYNLESGDVMIHIKPETFWTCVDIQVKMRKSDDDMRISDIRSPLVLVVENPEYGKCFCYFEDRFGNHFKSYLEGGKPQVCGIFQTKSDFEKDKVAKQKRCVELTKKYGAKNAKDIIDGVIRTGMTKQMVRESWGTPDKINRTLTSYGSSEQWIYGSSYIYFDGNRLTAIQD